MLSFIIISAYSLFLLFILLQLIGKIFTFKKNIKSQAKSLAFVSTFLALLFLLSLISFTLVLNFLFKLPIYSQSENPQPKPIATISVTDCPSLTNTINKTENQIGQKENHRYLEETANLFTIKLEYQKAAEKLKEQAQIYNDLELSADSQVYTQKIATKFKEQSDLFTLRTTIITNKAGIKKVYKILEKMDRLDQERLRLINQVKQQCRKA